MDVIQKKTYKSLPKNMVPISISILMILPIIFKALFLYKLSGNILLIKGNCLSEYITLLTR